MRQCCELGDSCAGELRGLRAPRPELQELLRVLLLQEAGLLGRAVRKTGQ